MTRGKVWGGGAREDCGKRVRWEEAREVGEERGGIYAVGEWENGKDVEKEKIGRSGDGKRRGK